MRQDWLSDLRDWTRSLREDKMVGRREGRKEKVKVLVTQSCSLFATPWTIALRAPLFMKFSRLKHWRGQPFPYSGDLPKPGIELGSLALQADCLPYEPPGKPKEGRGEDKIPSQVSGWSKN